MPIKLLQLLRTETTVSPRLMVFMTAVAGISNSLILVIINTAAEHASADSQSFRYLAMFVVTMVLFAFTQKYIMTTTVSEIETALHRIRVRVADKVRHGDLLPLEHIGRARIYDAIHQDTLAISQAAPQLTASVQAAVLTLFTMAYIAWLSLTAFLISVVFLIIAAAIYLSRSTRINRELHETRQRQNKLFDTMTDLLDGFKEIRINSARSEDLFRDVKAISDSATTLKIKTLSELLKLFIFAQLIFYTLLGCVVFLVPMYSETYSDVVVKIATAVLFLIGPVSVIVGGVPVFANINVSAERIYELEQQLERSISNDAGQAKTPFPVFTEIRFEGVVFNYHDPEADSQFTVGPVDLTISRGEILFITGGNGSGKSSFLKLLTALYYPQKGSIWVDKIRLNKSNYAAYREMFAVIFSDSYLFRRLYGLTDIDEKLFHDLLSEMELEDKTDLIEGEFETLELSDGQKKRLALLISLLEDKPIYVFDEWAAHQDPVFRKKFYEEILPQLKKRDKTIIAVTHDDRYFSAAERVLKMSDGNFI